MGKHNKKRKRGIKYHMLNLRLNEVEWGFLQSLKDKGVGMSEYIRTTMKTTPRYQDYLKVLYGNHKDEFLKSLPGENTKPSLPNDKWNSINVERDLLRDIVGTKDLTISDVIGCRSNDDLESHKLSPGDVNSNRQNNSELSLTSMIPLKSTSSKETLDINPINPNKIDKRYE